MKKTITTFLGRASFAFSLQSKDKETLFHQGGELALRLVEQEFNETTLANAQRELARTQLELEQISEELVRARDQNRLQQQEINRLTKAREPRQAGQLDRLRQSMVQKLQAVAAIITEGQRRQDLLPPTDQEKLHYLLRQVGQWLTAPEAELPAEEAAQALRFARLDVPPAYTRRRVRPEAAGQRVALPSTETHRQELTRLQEILARRSRKEILEDRLLARIESLLEFPEEQLRTAAETHPAFADLVKQWNGVRGLIQSLRESQENDMANP